MDTEIPEMDAATKQSIESLRKKIAANPKTKEIAKNLNMELNDYAGLVAHFKITGDEPQIFVAPDAVLKENGFSPPTQEKLLDFVKNEAKILESSGRASSFGGPQKPKVSLTDLPKVELKKGDAQSEALADALKKQMRGKNLK
jgi:hypothetical protein